ncbi:hypothetical protein BJ875DRAFT_118788 [Amylocarpus encephaloides]|uniref:HAUS augmin-like complex subunit 1 n=1 Tax=Amylocarpus encephaloides TaxID=45428 RepID=A0A9P7YDM9_9HELO|nr:hypothetical protein BJ875DRAFT_118788 [Amylocarpus encephaloides]
MAHLSLSPSAIFSPSVARQQIAAAKDWNYVDSWLPSKFNGKTPPAFERNNDTLKALLALAAVNESADEERELLSGVEAKSLRELQAREAADPNAQLRNSIEGALTRVGQTSLEALAAVSVPLNQPIVDLESMGRKVIDLNVAAYDLDQATDRVTILETHVKAELVKINALVDELQGEDYQPPSDLTKRTTEYQRKIKGLASKLPELKERIATLDATSRIPITREDVLAEEEKYKALLGVVKELEGRVNTYHGLPQDTDLARLELESLRVELRSLTRERDSMFEGLVERETPRKTR